MGNVEYRITISSRHLSRSSRPALVLSALIAAAETVVHLVGALEAGSRHSYPPPLPSRRWPCVPSSRPLFSTAHRGGAPPRCSFWSPVHAPHVGRPTVASVVLAPPWVEETEALVHLCQAALLTVGTLLTATTYGEGSSFDGGRCWHT